MLKKMKKLVVALATTLAVTVGMAMAAYAAEPQTGLIGAVQDAGLQKSVEMSQDIADYESTEGYGLARVTCTFYGPGGYTFWIRDYRGELGTPIPDETQELSGYRRGQMPEGLVFTDEPQEVEVLYYETSTGTPRKSSSGGSASGRPDDKPTVGEPPVATGSDAEPDTDIGEPPVLPDTDPDYEQTEEWIESTDPDGTTTSEHVTYRPQPDGTVEVEATTTVRHPDGRTDTMHTVCVRYPDGTEEMVWGEGVTELPPIKPIPGVPVTVPEEPVEIPPIDLGGIPPIPGVPVRVDEDGSLYTEGSDGERHYFDSDSDQTEGGDDPDRDDDEVIETFVIDLEPVQNRRFS